MSSASRYVVCTAVGVAVYIICRLGLHIGIAYSLVVEVCVIIAYLGIVDP